MLRRLGDCESGVSSAQAPHPDQSRRTTVFPEFNLRLAGPADRVHVSRFVIVEEDNEPKAVRAMHGRHEIT
jgi:hypothetical protein